MRISAFPNWAHPHTAHTVLERNPVRRSFVLFATAQQRRAGVCPRRRSRCEEYFSAARRGSETPAPRLRTAWMRPALLIHCARAKSLSRDVKKGGPSFDRSFNQHWHKGQLGRADLPVSQKRRSMPPDRFVVVIFHICAAQEPPNGEEMNPEGQTFTLAKAGCFPITPSRLFRQPECPILLLMAFALPAK